MILSIFLSFCLLNNVFGYCPACEQNNNFMNLMNSIRNGNYANNNNNNGVGSGQSYGTSNNYMGTGFGSTSTNNFNLEGYGNSNGGGSNSGSQWTNQPINGYNGNSFGTTSNAIGGLSGISGLSGINTNGNSGYGINGFSTNGNQNFNAIPVRIITTGGGYGCCNMNSFGPCCQPQQQQQQTFTQPQSFNTFIPNHSSFGGVQATPSNDVPGPLPHPSYSPPSSIGLSSSSATISSPQQSPTFDYASTVHNNVPFSSQPLQPKQNDATTITSATFDFYPQQHINTNQHLSPSSPYQSQQQQTQEFQYYKNPYGSAAAF
uniref:Uncharacterized protein n=1 Tax=Panagrolaimus sp. PS1159 TaxID=55785 RepID=A0AC35FTI1_9BILA